MSRISSVSLAIMVLTACKPEAVFLSAPEPLPSTLFSIANRGQIPSTGTSTLKTFTARSLMSCVDACANFAGGNCNGFVFQNTVCKMDADGTSSRTGSCQLVSFVALNAVTFSPSVNSCQRFYARVPFVSSGNVSSAASITPKTSAATMTKVITTTNVIDLSTSTQPPMSSDKTSRVTTAVDPTTRPTTTIAAATSAATTDVTTTKKQTTSKLTNTPLQDTTAAIQTSTNAAAAGYDCTASSNPCYTGSPQYFPYSFDTVHFVQCNNDICYVMPCSQGTNWNQGSNMCL